MWLVDRPEAHNALNLKVNLELAEAALACQESEDIRAVLVRADGAKSCTGGDLNRFIAEDEK